MYRIKHKKTTDQPHFCIGKPVFLCHRQLLEEIIRVGGIRARGKKGGRGIKMPMLVALQLYLYVYIYIDRYIRLQEEMKRRRRIFLCVLVGSLLLLWGCVLPCVYIYTSVPLCDQHRVRSGHVKSKRVREKKERKKNARGVLNACVIRFLLSFHSQNTPITLKIPR